MLRPSRLIRRGFSLIEVSIYSSLLMVLMGGVWLILQAGLRYYRTGEVHQRVLQEAAIAMRKMALEISNSTGPSVQAPTPQALVFLSADAAHPSSSGDWDYGTPPTQLRFRKWVCYYYNSAQRALIRCEDATASGLPTTAPPSWNSPTPPGLSTLQAITAPRRSVLARSVTAVTFTPNPLSPPAPAGSANQVVIDLSAAEETGSRTGQVTNVTLHTRAFVAN